MKESIEQAIGDQECSVREFGVVWENVASLERGILQEKSFEPTEKEMMVCKNLGTRISPLLT